MFKLRAFTLVELLVVIAIVGLLSTIVLAVTSGLGEQANIAKTLVWARGLQSLLGVEAVGIWNLDESPAVHEDTIYDMSGWGNNGIFYTNDGVSDKSVLGVVDEALFFDGTDDYVNCGNSEVLKSANGTAALWAKAEVLQEDKYVLSKASVAWSGLNWGIRLRNYNEIIGWAAAIGQGGDGGTGWIQTGRVPAQAGRWYHLVFVWKYEEGQSQGFLYIDGILSTSTGLVAWPIGTNQSVRIGGTGYYSQKFNGSIDEVRIYNTALTASQVRSQYYAGLNKLLARGLMSKDEYQQKLNLR
jgi:prepilin-type N-terminal cleavage/methylation domain-containing protein